MSLSLPAFRKALRSHLRPPLADLGFVAKGSSPFTRPSSLGADILRLPDRRELNRCLFSVNLGISINSVEKILRPESKDLFSTIWLPIHFLHADREFFEWPMQEEGDAANVASAMIEEIHSFALPFFEKYSSIEAIKRNLDSSAPSAWFALGPSQRVCVLAALEYLAGNAERALEVLEVSIAAERAKPIPRDRPMKKLLASLREGEVST